MFLALTGQALDATLLTLWGVFAIGMVDNFLRPLLVGKDAGIPDFLVLLSTLGGLPWFGIHSFVIGPLIAAMFFAVWDLYIRVRQIPAPAQMSEAANHDH
jgi:predicted PurR-regulated permease PerM